jgi:ubiquitin carboxyl-terminal hydrolase 9/13
LSSGPHHGHYISIIKTPESWFVFDDDNVFPISENDIPRYFGDSNSGSAYVLYYQAVNIDLVSLGLRPLEPSPETITNVIPPVEPYPSFQNQTLGPVPALPPGLNPNSAASLESDVDHHHLPPPTTSSLLPLHHSEPEDAPIPPISIPQSFSASPAGFGTKLINTIRRAPSTSGTRGTVGGSQGHVSNGGRSTVEKTPRSSLSIPPSEESLQEQPPPLPPLPPSILNRSNSPLNVTPIPNVQVTDRKEKEKDKTKSMTGGWFKKRKSIRFGEKSGVQDSYPSPAIKGDERHEHRPSTANHASLSPISSSPNTTLTDVVGHRPDHSRSEKSERDHRNNKINGYFRKSPLEPASPFAGSSFYFVDTPSTSTRSSSHTHSRSSTLLSDVGPGAQPDSPPSRKPPLAMSPGDRFRSQVALQNSSKPLSPSSSSGRPKTAPSSPSYRTTDFNMRSQAPLPPIPKINSHWTNLSLNNNQGFFTEPNNAVKGKTRFSDVDNYSSTSNNNLRGIPISEPPASMAASVGQNSSAGSTSSAALIIKRKLSLGFRKRDKEKDRDRDNFPKHF